jgi:hypothetical protein
MTPAVEDEILEKALALAVVGDFAALAAMLIETLERLAAGGASRGFLGKAHDLACRAILAAHDHSAAAQETVRRLCRLSVERYGKQPWSDLNEACLLHLAGAHDDAVPLYRAAACEVEIVLPLSNGCKTVVTMAEARSLSRSDGTDDIASRYSPMVIERMEPPRGPLAIFVAADHAYLIEHGDRFFTSVREHGAGLSAHLHLVNPQPEDYALIDTASRDGRWPALNLSTEVYDGLDQRAYFASVRMIRAPALLDVYACPLLISDIDSVYQTSIASTLPSLEDFDAGLFIKKDRFRANPWQTITADVLIYSPTEPGRRFCQAVARLILQIFDKARGNGLWFIDQNALYHTFLVARTDGWELRTADLGSPVTGLGLPGRIWRTNTGLPNKWDGR